MIKKVKQLDLVIPEGATEEEIEQLIKESAHEFLKEIEKQEPSKEIKESDIFEKIAKTIDELYHGTIACESEDVFESVIDTINLGKPVPIKNVENINTFFNRKKSRLEIIINNEVVGFFDINIISEALSVIKDDADEHDDTQEGSPCNCPSCRCERTGESRILLWAYEMIDFCSKERIKTAVLEAFTKGTRETIDVKNGSSVSYDKSSATITFYFNNGRMFTGGVLDKKDIDKLIDVKLNELYLASSKNKVIH